MLLAQQRLQAGQPPKSNADYWISKIGRNTARDARTSAELEAKGWWGLVAWECEIKDAAALADKLRAFLGSTPVKTTAKI